jgi:iron-sulfur cluster insertion protein
VWADPTSQTFLIEGKLDYVTDIMGSSFVITPPATTQSCGCGSSIVIA